MTTDKTPKPKAGSVGSRRRRRAIVAVIAVALACVAVILPTRTPVMKAVVLPRLERMLGVEIEAGRLYLTPGLRVVMTDASVRTPAVDGVAGELVAVERLEARLDWGRVLSGSAAGAARELVLTGPVLRLSQDVDTGVLNAATVGVQGTGSTALPERLPLVVIERGRLELGEHAGDAFTLLHDVPFEGELTPGARSATGSDVFVLRPRSSVARRAILGEAATGPELRGRIENGGVSVLISGVGVERWPASRVPTRLRPAYERLAIDGRIEPRRVRLDADGTVEVDISLQGVALDLPFTAVRPGADPTVGADERPLHLNRVTGELTAGTAGIRAAFDGFVDELPYEVAFDYDGLTADGPFLARLRAGPVTVERDTNVFRFTPEVVVDKLDMFLDPRVRVTSTVWLRRGTLPADRPRVHTAGLELPEQLEMPAGPSDSRILIAGDIELADGTASFASFPYPVEGIAGRFRFNQQRFIIDDITARTDTGASLLVAGVVQPLSDAARVDLVIEIDDIPLEQRLFRSLGPEREELLESLFSSARLGTLYDRGLLRAPGAGENASATDTTTGEGAPAFDIGGTANVRVDLVRLFGTESVWNQRLGVVVNDARILSRQFPVPLLGDGIEVVIEDNIATVDGAKLTTLRGGDITLSATADVSEGDDRSPPTIRIVGENVVVDDLLINALPTTGPIAETEGLTDLLDRLGLSGRVSCIADVEPASNTDVDWSVVVNVEGVESRPRHAEALADRLPEGYAGLVLEDITGVVRTDRERVELELTASARSDALPDRPPSRVELATAIALPTGDRVEQGVRSSLSVDGFEVELPIEPVISLFTTELAEQLLDLRDLYTPAGRLDFETDLAIDFDNGSGPGGEPRVELRTGAIDRVSADLLGGRFDLTGVTGAATLNTGAGTAVSFDALEADVRYDDDPTGRATLTGVLFLGDAVAWPLIGVPDFPLLGIELVGGRFESTLTRSIAVDRLGGRIAELHLERTPEGLYDLDLALEQPPVAPTVAPPVAPPDAPPASGDPDADANQDAVPVFDVSGELRPRSITLATSTGRLGIDAMDGAVRFSPTGGAFEGLSGNGDGWRFDSTGDWRLAQGGAFRFTADVGATVDPDPRGLPEDLLDALPDWAATTVAGLGLDATRGLELIDGRLTVEQPDADANPGGGLETLATGDVLVRGGKLEVGMPITEVDGRVRFEAWAHDTSSEPQRGWTLSIAADRLYVSGIEMTDARSSVISGREPGRVLIPSLSADVYGGRFAGSMRIDPIEGAATLPGAPPPPPAFTGEMRLADVRLAPLIEALALGIRPEDAVLAEAIAAADERRSQPGVPMLDESRGVVDADLTASGRLGLREGLRGRGSLRASGGPVLAFPLLTPLIEFSNLQLPSGERLDLAEAAFFVDGDTVAFESLGVLSNSIEIVGFGTMDWPTAELDLRFRSEAVRRVPLLSDVIEAVRDELITTRVTGPAGSPQVSAETLTATRRVLATLFGLPETPEAGRLRRIEERARTERSRAVGVIRRSGPESPSDG